MTNRDSLGIGELARLAACRVDTIRYYERIGLLPQPERSVGGQRRYREQAARRLLFIRRLRDLGFGLDEVGEFLAMLRRQSYGCSEFKKIADGRAAAIRQKIDGMRRLERRLRDISARCAEGALAKCGIVEALWGADLLALDVPLGPAVCCGG